MLKCALLQGVKLVPFISMSFPNELEHLKPILLNRLQRRYLRLCRMQEEMSRLDFKNAAPGVSPEDFIFSRIDFSRYKEIPEKEFEELYLGGLDDFNEVFLKNNFGLGLNEIRSLIKNSYKKAEGTFKLQRENPVILSIMRTLETSLDDKPLFNAEECGDGFFYSLISSLDGVTVTHGDGMTTRLFVSADGGLSATFQPAGKPWTRVLVNVNGFAIPL